MSTAGKKKRPRRRRRPELEPIRLMRVREILEGDHNPDDDPPVVDATAKAMDAIADELRAGESLSGAVLVERTGLPEPVVWFALGTMADMDWARDLRPNDGIESARWYLHDDY